MSQPRDESTWTPVRVMRMLRELHRRGFQQLRLSSGVSPAGLHWRYTVAPASHFEPAGYRLQPGRYPGYAASSSNGSDQPFNWSDAAGMDAVRLADTFLERFPAVGAAGDGQDEAYATWFEALLEACEPDGAPIMYGEFVDPSSEGITTSNRRPGQPLPPGIPGQT